jgi:isoprene synthase
VAMQDELYRDRVKKVEEDVMSMINNENADLLETLELIDDVQRLGLGYRFEKDITRVLENFASGCYNERVEKSLHATALSFRLLRQHGFEVSQGTNYIYFWDIMVRFNFSVLIWSLFFILNGFIL